MKVTSLILKALLIWGISMALSVVIMLVVIQLELLVNHISLFSHILIFLSVTITFIYIIRNITKVVTITKNEELMKYSLIWGICVLGVSAIILLIFIIGDLLMKK